MLCFDLSDENAATSISSIRMWLRWLFTHLMSFDLETTTTSNSNLLYKIIFVGVKEDRCHVTPHPVVQHLRDICNEFPMLPIHTTCVLTSSREAWGREILLETITSICDSILKSSNNIVPTALSVVEQIIQQHQQLDVSQLVVSKQALFETVISQMAHYDPQIVCAKLLFFFINGMLANQF